VETYCRHWLENIAPASRAPISVERYATLINVHLLPHLGHIALQAFTRPRPLTPCCSVPSGNGSNVKKGKKGALRGAFFMLRCQSGANLAETPYFEPKINPKINLVNLRLAYRALPASRQYAGIVRFFWSGRVENPYGIPPSRLVRVQLRVRAAGKREY